jgi:hypothetical protein
MTTMCIGALGVLILAAPPAVAIIVSMIVYFKTKREKLP